MLCEGYEYVDIAEALKISKSTIKVHVRNIKVKLDVRNVAQIVRWAVENQMEQKEGK